MAGKSKKKKKDDDNDAIIICARIEDVEPHRVARGSLQKACERCHRVIYVSPSTLFQAAGKKTHLVCMNCVTPEDLSDADGGIQVPSQAVLNEVREATAMDITPEDAKQMVKDLKRELLARARKGKRK